jgi:hypothetical protein
MQNINLTGDNIENIVCMVVLGLVLISMFALKNKGKE